MQSFHPSHDDLGTPPTRRPRSWKKMGWLCAWCQLGVGAGCWRWVLSISWLCAWWKQGAWCWLCACGAVSWRAGAGCWCCGGQGATGLLVVCVVQIRCWRRVLALAVRVVETRRAVLRVKIGAAANAAQKNLLHAFAIWGLCWSNLQLYALRATPVLTSVFGARVQKIMSGRVIPV